MQDREPERTGTEETRSSGKTAAERAPRDDASPRDEAERERGSEGGTTSRPRGHTEDPDRTL
jgi:hypothetical protein